MALFGEQRDISLFRHLNRELIERIIQQTVGYYKIDLEASKENLYGEAVNKFYKDPVLVTCLLERGDDTAITDEKNLTSIKTIYARFLRDTLVDINLVPELGDIIMWNENYFEVSNVNENELIVGKDPSYSYDPATDNFGSSLSIIVRADYVRPEHFGISQSRL
jgi:transcriptional regulator with PAS, ATPase and Fis domain